MPGLLHHQCYVKHLDPRERCEEHHHILIVTLGSQDPHRFETRYVCAMSTSGVDIAEVKKWWRVRLWKVM